MIKRYIILQPIGQNRGNGVVALATDSVTVSVSDTEEEFSLIFMNASDPTLRIDAGLIRGNLTKTFRLLPENAQKIDTVVLLRQNEPVMFGSLKPGAMPEKSAEAEKRSGQPEKRKPDAPIDGYTWTRIEDGRFPDSDPMIRHIFQNIAVIGRINACGFYLYGTNADKAAVAIAAKDNEGNPFLHLADCARKIGGYWTVGADKKERYFFSLCD